MHVASVGVTYDHAFFASISGTAQLSARVVLPLVFDLVGSVGSVLDVGCGTGSWVAVAQELGARDVLGVDGDYVPRDQLLIAPDDFLAHDLERPLDVGRRFDLTISVEVAEHLPARSAAEFVRSLTRHSDAVLFSAALPGQGGEHHVNEQPASYWAQLFSDNGFETFDYVRPRIWGDDDVMYYHRQNLLLFARGAAAATLRDKDRASGPLDIVHPAQLRYWHELGASEAWPQFKSALWRTARHRFTQAVHRRT